MGRSRTATGSLVTKQENMCKYMCSHSTPVDVRMARMQVRQLPVRLCTAACFKGIPDAVRLAGWLPLAELLQ